MFANWKTTLAGVLTAVAHLSVNGIGWKQIITAVGMAALGALAKDHSAK